MPVTTPFEYFVGRQNRKLVDMLEANREVSQFFMSVLEHLVAHAEANGKRFDQLKIEDPYVTPDGHIRARIR
jgi:ribosomal protein L22